MPNHTTALKLRRSKDLLPGEMVTAISLWEPWASLMAVGSKQIETRHWPIRYRGPLLICAAKRRVLGELREYLEDEFFQAGLATLAPGRAVEIDDLKFGQAVALVDVIGCRSTENLRQLGKLSDDETYFGNYSSGRYGWITSGLRRLWPFEVRGKQGLFQVRLPQNLEDWPSTASVEISAGGSGAPAPFTKTTCRVFNPDARRTRRDLDCADGRAIVEPSR